MAGEFASPKNPNPQGKGVVPVLQDWQALSPLVGGTRSPREFLRDYCLSSLVLAAEFRFRPVVGKTYYLYAAASRWKLSMIAPQEWRNGGMGEYFARCTLRPDMTWEVETQAAMAEDSEALQAAREFAAGFTDTLAGSEDIVAGLPVYVRELPYYRRMLASALAASLKRSCPADEAGMHSLLEEGAESWALPAPEGSCHEAPLRQS